MATQGADQDISIRDALSVLGITEGAVTQKAIKNAYRTAAFKYHPDRNAAGLEMMQFVNKAYEALKGFSGDIKGQYKQDYGKELNDALNAVIVLGLEIERCGAWLWVSGNTKLHRETLKAAGFKWAPKKIRWYFRPAEYKSFSRGNSSMDDIRENHGSEIIKNNQRHLSC